MSEENENGRQVELGDKVKGEIELPSVDVSQFVGKEVNIVKVTEHQGEYGYFIKVQTEMVDTFQTKDKLVEIRGSRIFGLQEDENGDIGWGKDTKLGVYLKKMGVAHYRDLKGKVVKLQTQTSKSGKDFLTFN